MTTLVDSERNILTIRRHSIVYGYVNPPTFVLSHFQWWFLSLLKVRSKLKLGAQSLLFTVVEFILKSILGEYVDTIKGRRVFYV